MIIQIKKKTSIFYFVWSKNWWQNNTFTKHAIRLRQNGMRIINVKSTKTLSFFPMAEAYGLIYRRPSGENSSFGA